MSTIPAFDPDDSRPPNTPERQALMARMAVVVAKIRKRMAGHKMIDLACGWTGDELDEEGKCPKCGEEWGGLTATLFCPKSLPTRKPPKSRRAVFLFPHSHITRTT